jgi:hypothetical protein
MSASIIETIEVETKPFAMTLTAAHLFDALIKAGHGDSPVQLQVITRSARKVTCLVDYVHLMENPDGTARLVIGGFQN